MNSHPDLDYYDLMPLDELAECAMAASEPLSFRLWRMLDGRTGARDAFLDLAEKMDRTGELLMGQGDQFILWANGYSAAVAQVSGNIEKKPIWVRDADHG